MLITDDDGQLNREYTSIDAFRERVKAEVARFTRRRVLCGLTAAKWWDLPIPPGREIEIGQGQLHAAVVSGERTTDTREAFGHELDLPSEHIVRFGEVFVTSPARTWLDCAALIPEYRLAAMGDVLLRRQIASTDEIHNLLRWAYRRRGVAAARRVVDHLDARSESPPESIVRWHFHVAGLPKPSVNPEIVLPGFRTVRLDLAYVTLRIGIEYDGDWHVATRKHDAERRAQLERAGWLIVVVRKEDLDNPESIISCVREHLNHRCGRARRW